jgi:hypothetical protein
VGITTENNKRARVRKSPPGTKNTKLSAGTPTYFPTDAKKPDLLVLDSFVTSGISPSYTDIKPSFDPSSDYTPTIMTINTSIATHITTTRLYTSITDYINTRQ